MCCWKNRLPSGHSKRLYPVPSGQYSPWMHSSGVVIFGSHAYDSGHTSHALIPVLPVYVPSPQPRGTCEPSGQYQPLGQIPPVAPSGLGVADSEAPMQ